MGSFITQGGRPDAAVEVEVGPMAALDATTPIAIVKGWFNLAVRPTPTLTGTIVAERSFDGTNWLPAFNRHTGTAIQFTAAGSISAFEPEEGVGWRLRMSVAGGSAEGRISQ